MDESAIAIRLDELQELHNESDNLNVEYQALRAKILAKVQAELDALDEEWFPLTQEARDRVIQIETDTKDMVLLHGASVKGTKLQAVYNKGRTTWDHKGLSRYALANPTVLGFRKTGKPTVSIRPIK